LSSSPIDFEKDLESYVSSVIEKCELKKVGRKKIIRDAVLGSHELSPLEVKEKTL
jgi:hypothetical protein